MPNLFGACLNDRVNFPVAKWCSNNCIGGVILNDEKKVMVKGLHRKFLCKVKADGTVLLVLCKEGAKT